MQDAVEVVEETTIEEETPEVEMSVEETRAEELNNKAAADLEAKNRQLYERAKKAEAEAKAAKLEAERLKSSKASLDVNDYIDISASLEGLDQRQKEYLAEQHALTGQPIKDLRNGENFQLWNEGYTAKQEKERALKPNSVQSETDKPQNFASRLAGAKTLAEQEELLKKAGLYKENRPRADRTIIG